ncbi:hypothetical protein BD289DRAFT_28002 [Coniella lustricola]|uniref:Uncharacterized protein n=1 Tax=Coniella lustricola TaxID=2025994 RepID=A0A2T3AIW5_9PEZI|nr:hypothetical protein BD289DRAFT_28002 [Coniella lustricola]
MGPSPRLGSLVCIYRVSDSAALHVVVRDAMIRIREGGYVFWVSFFPHIYLDRRVPKPEGAAGYEQQGWLACSVADAMSICHCRLAAGPEDECWLDGVLAGWQWEQKSVQHGIQHGISRQEETPREAKARHCAKPMGNEGKGAQGARGERADNGRTAFFAPRPACLVGLEKMCGFFLGFFFFFFFPPFFCKRCPLQAEQRPWRADIRTGLTD